MDEFHFLRPLWLLLLVPAVLVWYGLWRQTDRVATWMQVIDAHLLEHLLVGESTRQRLRPIHLLLVAWLVATIALAGPAWQLEPSPFADDEAGLVVLLKVNSTMMASDVQPSRLERAKLKLRDLLESRRGSSTGLIVYSGSAHLVMPLTRDDRIVSAMIEDLTPDLMPEDGDALVDALQSAERLLQESGVPGSALVMADSVSTVQAQRLAVDEVSVPVQFLSMRAFGAPIDRGLASAADSLNAPVIGLTPDQADVHEIASRAETSIKSVSTSEQGTRWIDAGYFLLPFLALITLMWSRKGWLVK